MATLNLILDKRRAKKDGTYPLVFRVRLREKFCDIGTGFSLKEDQFDQRTSSILNDLIANHQIEELKRHYLDRMRAYLVSNVGNESMGELKACLIKRDVSEVTIIDFWKEEIDSLNTAGRFGGAKVYKTSLSVLSQEYNLNIPFAQFKYQDLMVLERKLFQRGLARNSINVYFRTLRAIFNQAIKHDLISYESYPFRKYRFSKVKTSPRVLTESELKSYFSLDINNEHPLYRAWLLGKLIFMLRGINITDLVLLSSENIKGNRVIYRRAKTGKIYSVRLLPETIEVLDKFVPNTTLLGVINDQEYLDKNRLVDVIAMRRKVINNQLKRISRLIDSQEPITTYVFRYSYANIAKKLGYSKDLIAEALGHEYGNSVTGIYLEQFDLEVVDEMNKVIVKKVGS